MDGFEIAHYNLELDYDRLVDYAIRLGMPTIKRVGWALEAVGADPDIWRPLAEIPTESFRNLNPTWPRGGVHNRRWMVRENIRAEVLL